jgi:hypothetical protein
MTDPRIPDDDPRLRDAIARLPEEILPARDLWPEIRAELEADRVRALPLDRLEARDARRRLPWPGLAAAAAVLIVATAGITWRAMRPDTPATDASVQTFTRFASYERSAAELTAALDQRAVSLDPATRAVLERSLRTIDEALTEARAALADDPASAEIRAYVESAYRHKIDFLRRANDVAALRGT